MTVTDEASDIAAIMRPLGVSARAAARTLAGVPGARRGDALRRAAAAIRQQAAAIRGAPPPAPPELPRRR